MLPSNVNNTKSASNNSQISNSSSIPSPSQPEGMPRIARVNSFTRDGNSTPQTVPLVQVEVAASAERTPWEGVCSREEYLRLLLQDFCFADETTTSCASLEPGLRCYEASADGACMFRSFFAALTRNCAWLSVQSVSRQQLVQALNQSGLASSVRMAIAKTLQLALTATHAENVADHPLLAFGFDADGLQIIGRLLASLANLEGAEGLYQATIARGQFSLWRTDAIRSYLESAAPEAIALLSEEQTNALAEYLANFIAQCVIEQLDIPIQTNLPVHLRADGLHYNLVAPADFFQPHYQGEGAEFPQVAEEVLAALNRIVPPLPEPERPTHQRLIAHRVENEGSSYPLFRLLLAGITQDEFWLSAACTTELLQDVAMQFGWTTGQQQAATDVVALLAASSATKEQLQKLGFLEHEQEELLGLLTTLHNSGFDFELWAESGFGQAIWEGAPLRQQLFNGLSEAEIARLQRMFNIRFDRFIDWFGSQIERQFLGGIGAVYDQPDRVHINIQNKQPHLSAPEDFFSVDPDSPRRNHLLSHCSNEHHKQLVAGLKAISAPSSDAWIAGLNERWGPQQENEQCDGKNPPEDDDWDDWDDWFTKDHSKSYKEFVKKISGFDPEEEMRNRSDRPLISQSQAIEALGSLVGDAANYLNSTVAERYNYRLRPYANPDQRTFASYMDEFTGRVFNTFSDFFNSFTDHADIVREVERMTLQEAANLDVKFAEDLERFLRQKGPLEQSTQELIDNLKAIGGATLRDLSNFGFSSEGVNLTLEQLRELAHKRVEAGANKRIADLKKQLPRFPEWLFGQHLHYQNNKQDKKQRAAGENKPHKTPLQANDPSVEPPQAGLTSTITDNRLLVELNAKRQAAQEQSAPQWLGAVEDLQNIAPPPPAEAAPAQFASENNLPADVCYQPPYTDYRQLYGQYSRDSDKPQTDNKPPPDNGSPSSGNGAFFFGGADAAPIRRTTAQQQQELEKYTQEYEKFSSVSTTNSTQPITEKEQVHERKKRRAGPNADPFTFFSFNFPLAMNPKIGEKMINFSSLKRKIVEYVAEVRQGGSQQLVKLEQVAEEIHNIRSKTPLANRFMQETLDLYLMRMMDTSAEVRQGQGYFHLRTREAVLNRKMYHDTGLDEFYGFKINPDFSNPEKIVSSRTDWLLAKVLAAVEQNISLPPVQLGLAVGELSVHRQLANAKIEAPYLRAIEEMHYGIKKDAAGKNTVVSLNKALKNTPLDLGGGNEISFSPKLSPLSKLMSDGAPLSQRGQGACNLFAVAAAYEIKKASLDSAKANAKAGQGHLEPVNTKALKQILYKMENLEAKASTDPSKAYRLLEGLTRVNENLQSQYREVLSPKKKSMNVAGAMAYMQSADDPVVFTFRNVDGSGDGHTISVSKVVSAGVRDPSQRRTTYLVMDGNLGVIPCVTLEHAQKMVRVSANRFLELPPENTDFSQMKVSAYQLDAGLSQNMGSGKHELLKHARVSRVIGDDCYSYHHVFSEDMSWDLFAKNHAASESSNWRHLLPPDLVYQAVQGDHNIGSGLRNPNTGQEGSAAFITKTQDFVEMMVTASANRAAGCTTGNCELDLRRYLDMSSEETARGDKWREQAIRVKEAEAIDTTEKIIYSEVGFKAHADGAEHGSVGRGIYSDMDEVFEQDLGQKSSRVKGSTERSWQRVGDFESAPEPIPPRRRPKDAFSGQVDMGELASNLGKMKAQAEANLASEAHIRQIDTHTYTDQYRRYQGAILGYDQLPEEPPPPVPRRPDTFESPPKVPNRAGNGNQDKLPAVPPRTDTGDIPPEVPRRAGNPDKLPAIPPRNNLAGNEDVPPVVPRRGFAQADNHARGGERVFSGQDSATSAMALARAGQVLEAAATAEGLASGKVGSKDGGIARRGAVRGRGVGAQQDSAVAISVARSAGGETVLLYNNQGHAEQVRIQQGEGGSSGGRGNRYRQAGKQALGQVQEQVARRKAPPPPPPEGGGAEYGPMNVKAEVHEFIPLRDLNRLPESSVGAGDGLSAIATKMAVLDDPEFLRAMYLSAEEANIEAQRMLAMSQAVDEECAQQLRAAGKNPSEWKAVAPAGDNDQTLGFVYRGTDAAQQGQTTTVRLSEELRSRWRGLKQDIDNLSQRIMQSEVSVKVQSIAASKHYQRLGKVTGMISKAMNLYTLYNLAYEAENIKNLQPLQQVAAGLGAVDAVGDAVANIVGAVNKIYKLTHVGTASSALQVTSRAFSQISSAIGVVASVGSFYAQLSSLTAARTDFEYDIATTNVAFATVGLALTGIAMAFPVAAPVIAVVGLIMFAVQMAIINYKMEQEKHRQAGEYFDKAFANTEDILELIELIATHNEDDVSVTGEGESLKIVIAPKTAIKSIEIKADGTITLIHSDKAVEIALKDNTDFTFITRTSTNGSPMGRALLTSCDNNNEGGACSSAIPPVLKAFAANSGYCFPGGKAKAIRHLGIGNEDGQKHEYETKIREYGEPQLKANEIVIDCLLRASVTSQSDYNAASKKYMINEQQLPQEAAPLLLTEIYPKVTLLSDMENYELTKDTNQYSAPKDKPRVTAISSAACKKVVQEENGYNPTRAGETCGGSKWRIERVTGDNDKTICDENAKCDWTTRAKSALYPQGTCDGKTVPPKQVKAGRVAYAMPSTYSGGTVWIQSRDVLSERIADVATPVKQVMLEPANTKMKFDFAKDKAKPLVIMPEKYSTEFLLKRLTSMPITAPSSIPDQPALNGLPALPRSKNLLIDNEWTAKKITKPSAYDIQLTANAPQQISVGMGAVVELTELDSTTPTADGSSAAPSYSAIMQPTTSALTSSTLRHGNYHFTFFATNSAAIRQQRIKELEKQQPILKQELKDNEERLTYAKEQTQQYINEWTNETGLMGKADRRELIWTNLVEPALAWQNRCEHMVEQRKQQIAEVQRLLALEPEIKTYNNEHFKLRVTKTNSDITLVVGEQTEPKKGDHSGLLTSATVSIKDCQRDIFISHRELVSVGERKQSVVCEFKVDHQSQMVSLVQLAELDALQNGAETIAALVKQLKHNNPNINIPDNITVRSLNLSAARPADVGKVSDEPEGENGFCHKKKSTKNYSDDFAGHALVIGANSNNPIVVNVMLPKAEYQQHFSELQDLSYLGTENIGSSTEIPQEYLMQYECAPLAKKLVYYLYNPKTRKIFKQWMGLPMHIGENSGDVETCQEGTKPKKFTRPDFQSSAYICATPDYLQLSDVIRELKKQAQPDLGQKLNQLAKEYRSSLKLLNPGTKGSDQANIPLLMLFNGGETPNLLIMPKEPSRQQGVFFYDYDKSQAVLGEEVAPATKADGEALSKLNLQREKLGLEPLSLLQLSTVRLYQGAELTTLLQEWMNNGLPGTLPSSVVPKRIALNSDLPLVAAQRNSDGSLLLETLSGVTFSTSADLAQKHLVAVRSSYWQSKGIDTKNNQQVLTEYKKLTAQFGEPEIPYVKLSDGEADLLATPAPEPAKKITRRPAPVTAKPATEPSTHSTKLISTAGWLTTSAAARKSTTSASVSPPSTLSVASSNSSTSQAGISVMESHGLDNTTSSSSVTSEDDSSSFTTLDEELIEDVRRCAPIVYCQDITKISGNNVFMAFENSPAVTYTDVMSATASMGSTSSTLESTLTFSSSAAKTRASTTLITKSSIPFTSGTTDEEGSGSGDDILPTPTCVKRPPYCDEMSTTLSPATESSIEASTNAFDTADASVNDSVTTDTSATAQSDTADSTTAAAQSDTAESSTPEPTCPIPKCLERPIPAAKNYNQIYKEGMSKPASSNSTSSPEELSALAASLNQRLENSLPAAAPVPPPAIVQPPEAATDTGFETEIPDVTYEPTPAEPNPEEQMLLLNSITHELLRVPRTRQTSPRTILLATLTHQLKILELTALDPETKHLISVHYPSQAQKARQSQAVKYQYFNMNNQQCFLALPPGLQRKTLPYLPVTQLALMPQQILGSSDGAAASKQIKATPLRVNPIMQQQLKFVTLISASKKEDQKAASELSPKLEVRGDNRPIKAFTSTRLGGKKSLYIALPTKLLANGNKAALSYLSGTFKDLSTTHLLVLLHDALDEQGKLKPELTFDIEFNGKAITKDRLEELLKNASAFQDTDNVAEAGGSEEQAEPDSKKQAESATPAEPAGSTK